MMCHACPDQLSGGTSMFADEDDHPCACRLARVGNSLVAVDFAGAPGRSRFRQIDILPIEAGNGRGFRTRPETAPCFLPCDASLYVGRVASEVRSGSRGVVWARHDADAGRVAAGDGPDRGAPASRKQQERS